MKLRSQMTEEQAEKEQKEQQQQQVHAKPQMLQPASQGRPLCHSAC